MVHLEVCRNFYDVKTIRGLEEGTSNHSVILFKVRLVWICIKRREEVNGIGRIRTERGRTTLQG